MDDDVEANIKQRTHEYLTHLGIMFSHSNPSLSRFYLSSRPTLKRPDSNTSTKNSSQNMKNMCPYCLTVYQTNNHHLRMKPRMKISKTIWKLLKKERGKRMHMSKFKKKLLADYLNSENQLITTCNLCHKTFRIPCQNRSNRLKQKSKQIVAPPAEPLAQVKKREKQQKKRHKKFDEASLSLLDKKEQDNKRKYPSIELKDTSNDDTQKESESKRVFAQSQLGGSPTLRSATKSTRSNVVQEVKINQKQKSKNFHRQLQEIINKDQSSNKSGSLADFLTTI